MISLNESADFEVFETSPSMIPDQQRKVSSTGSTGSFLDVWEIDSGSLRYSGSHASLLNNLAFESGPDDDGRPGRETTRAGHVEENKGKSSSRYNEIKRTVALASEQDDVDPIETDDVSSNALSLDENIDPKETNNREQTEKNGFENTYDVNGPNKKVVALNDYARNKTEITDEIKGQKSCKVQQDDSLDKNKEEIRLQDEINEKPIASYKENKNTEENCKEITNNKNCNETESLESVYRGEEKIERDTERVKDSNKRKYDDNRGNLYESDDEMFNCSRNNQITTVVEVHAENDLSDIDEGSELDIADDSLIPEQEGAAIEIDVDYEQELEFEVMCNDSHELRKDQIAESDMNEKTQYEDTHKTEENQEIMGENNQKSEVDEKIDTKVEIKNEDTNIDSIENGITQSLNQIKHYNARVGDTIPRDYSYKDIEKKIESANKHIINVKSKNITRIIDTKNNIEARVLDKHNKSKENMMPRNQSGPTRLDIQLVRPKKVETHYKIPKLETTNPPQSENTPRPELPMLNKSSTKKPIDIKLNRKSEDKIPQIKNEASFDMRLLIKAINDLENAEPKTGYTRSNSARSSEVSKKSNTSKNSTNSKKSSSSTKSNGSNAKRPNMSFSKDEAKKIDLENQILLKKIMSQKPQPPPGTDQQIRRKPTAYINRQKLQDRISHDNTILERKLMSIKKRKERISVL